MLGIPLHRLTWLVYGLWEHRRYTRFEIQRYGGAPPREILAPVKPLKDVQRALATKLLEWYDPPVGVHGFVRARSAVSNARTHQRQEWVLRIDIEDFFPSINFGRVYGLFKAHPFGQPGRLAGLRPTTCVLLRPPAP
jgi:RNA-directed DNA polymerase